METEPRRQLAGVKWVVMAMYAAPLTIFPLLGPRLDVTMSLEPEMLRTLAIVLGAVAILDYGFSLFVERKLLARPTTADAGHSTLATVPLVTAAFGVSLAVYGFVLCVLGGRGWGLPFYVLALIHWAHLMLRWPSHERAADQQC